MHNATEDEYVTAGEVERIVAAAREPRRLWRVAAHDHRFSDTQPEFLARLDEALAWIRPGGPARATGR